MIKSNFVLYGLFVSLIFPPLATLAMDTPDTPKTAAIAEQVLRLEQAWGGGEEDAYSSDKGSSTEETPTGSPIKPDTRTQKSCPLPLPLQSISQAIAKIGTRVQSKHTQYTSILIDLDQITEQFNQWNTQTKSAPHYYSVSNNNDPHVLRKLCQLGSKFYTVSHIEIERVMHACGCPKTQKSPCMLNVAQLMASAQLMDPEQMTYALTAGMRQFSFKSLVELKKMQKTLATISPAITDIKWMFQWDGSKQTLTPDLIDAICQENSGFAGIEWQATSLTKAMLTELQTSLNGKKGCYQKIKTYDCGGMSADQVRDIQNQHILTDEIQLIGRPDLVSASTTIATRVIAVQKKQGSDQSMPFLSDGVYGILHPLLTEGLGEGTQERKLYTKPITLHQYNATGRLMETLQDVHLTSTQQSGGLSCWGPTCDSIDKFSMNKTFKSPLTKGDYVVIQGLANIDARSDFNAMKPGSLLIKDQGQIHSLLKSSVSSPASQKSVKYLPSDNPSKPVTQAIQDTESAAKRVSKSFRLINLADLDQRIQNWMTSTHQTIMPFYAVKANPHPEILSSICAQSQIGFDAATEGEVTKVTEACKDCCQKTKQGPCCSFVIQDRVIMAHPRKTEQGLQQVTKLGVTMSTFDSLEELQKMSEIPTSVNILRIKIPKKDLASSSSSIDLASKFGLITHSEKQTVTPEFQAILTACNNHQSSVKGISFHIGTNTLRDNLTPEAKQLEIERIKAAYQEHIESAYQALNLLNQNQCTPQFLDLGGGWVGVDLDIHNDIMKSVLSKIDQMKEKYPQLAQVKFIAEPGRYMNTSVMTLGAKVHAVGEEQRGTETTPVIYLADGAYGNLHDLYMGLEVDFKVTVWNADGTQAPTPDKTSWKKTRLRGPSGQSDDVIEPMDTFLLPAMQEGQYLIFENAGAYTNATQTRAGSVIPSQDFVTQKVKPSQNPATTTR